MSALARGAHHEQARCLARRRARPRRRAHSGGRLRLLRLLRQPWRPEAHQQRHHGGPDAGGAAHRPLHAEQLQGPHLGLRHGGSGADRAPEGERQDPPPGGLRQGRSHGLSSPGRVLGAGPLSPARRQHGEGQTRRHALSAGRRRPRSGRLREPRSHGGGRVHRRRVRGGRPLRPRLRRTRHLAPPEQLQDPRRRRAGAPALRGQGHEVLRGQGQLEQGQVRGRASGALPAALPLRLRRLLPAGAARAPEQRRQAGARGPHPRSGQALSGGQLPQRHHPHQLRCRRRGEGQLRQLLRGPLRPDGGEAPRRHHHRVRVGRLHLRPVPGPQPRPLRHPHARRRQPLPHRASAQPGHAADPASRGDHRRHRQSGQAPQRREHPAPRSAPLRGLLRARARAHVEPQGAYPPQRHRAERQDARSDPSHHRQPPSRHGHLPRRGHAKHLLRAAARRGAGASGRQQAQRIHRLQPGADAARTAGLVEAGAGQHLGLHPHPPSRALFAGGARSGPHLPRGPAHRGWARGSRRRRAGPRGAAGDRQQLPGPLCHPPPVDGAHRVLQPEAGSLGRPAGRHAGRRQAHRRQQDRLRPARRGEARLPPPAEHP